MPGNALFLRNFRRGKSHEFMLLCGQQVHGFILLAQT
nr:MAG TPA: hypothetical protein [Ackermannviridae sp.]